MRSPDFWRRAALLAFLAALALVLYMAFRPVEHHGAEFWDKGQHFLAFYVLALLGAAAFARGALPRLVLGLFLLGGLIEAVQATPLVHRDAEWGDWIADSIGLAAALGPTALPRLRRWLAG